MLQSLGFQFLLSLSSGCVVSHMIGYLVNTRLDGIKGERLLGLRGGYIRNHGASDS